MKRFFFMFAFTIVFHSNAMAQDRAATYNPYPLGSLYVPAPTYSPTYSTLNNYGPYRGSTYNYGGPSYTTINNYGNSRTNIYNYGTGYTTVNDYGRGRTTVFPRR